MGKDSGVLDEVTWDDSMSEDCGVEATSYWEMSSACLPADTSTSTYTQMEANDSKRWRFDMHFTDLPDNLIYDGCYNDDELLYQPEPINFRWEIAIADSEDVNQLFLSLNQHQMTVTQRVIMTNLISSSISSALCPGTYTSI